MSQTLRRLAAPLFLLVASLVANAQEGLKKPFLWRIEGRKPSYVFGTIHLARKDVTTLGPKTREAVNSADALFTEIPMDLREQMKASMALMNGGEPLTQVLPKEVLKRCEAELKRINPALSLEPFEHMKVWALGVTLALIEEQLKNPGAQPLDAVLFTTAQASGKEVGGLETVESQVGVFDQFSKEEQIAMLVATLDDLEKGRKEGRSPMDELREAYLSGDPATLDGKLNEWMKEFDPKLLAHFTEALFTKRNLAMVDGMTTRMKAAPEKSYFFAIGAGHLLGDEGVLKLLEKRGFKLTRVAEAP